MEAVETVYVNFNQPQVSCNEGGNIPGYSFWWDNPTLNVGTYSSKDPLMYCIRIWEEWGDLTHTEDIASLQLKPIEMRNYNHGSLFLGNYTPPPTEPLHYEKALIFPETKYMKDQYILNWQSYKLADTGVSYWRQKDHRRGSQKISVIVYVCSPSGVRLSYDSDVKSVQFDYR
jgi:hypothetical protein